MYMKVKINSNDILLTTKQAERLADLMADALCMDTHYVGSGKGDDGGSYTLLLRPASRPERWFSADLVPDDYVAALELKTKLHDESSK